MTKVDLNCEENLINLGNILESRSIYNKHGYKTYWVTTLEVLPRCLIHEHSFNTLRYANDSEIMVDIEKNVQELLDKVVKESSEKGLIIVWSLARRTGQNAT